VKNTDPMKSTHPKEKDPKVIPHDPRNEPIPAEKDPVPAERNDGRRVNENDEDKARKDAGVGAKGPRDWPKELRPDQVIVNPNPNDDVLPTGIQTGQTTRGSYSTDPATGGGRYADHRAGQFGTSPVAQPGNDEEVEPDPIDPKL
jgi:hypothetical protein